MAKVNVYLPDDLHAEMIAANMTFSAFVQDTLRCFLDDRQPGEYDAGHRTGTARRRTEAVSVDVS